MDKVTSTYSVIRTTHTHTWHADAEEDRGVLDNADQLCLWAATVEDPPALQVLAARVPVRDESCPQCALHRRKVAVNKAVQCLMY